MSVEERHGESLCDEYKAWEKSGYSVPSAVRNTLDRIGDKWSVLVVLRLGAGPVRFLALMRTVDGISQRMLTVTLRSLERDGLVNRKVYDTRPPAVEYGLTERGKTLLYPIKVLVDWSYANADEIEASHKGFDGE
ncbi:winged helix-turn-helix transcriptional regulator [Maritalea sp.]|uniref:winged helix-turn-helix transcriptional regulator n=1 Tax=Maritalea sp. TaxID=2003361 RepID=UPI003EF44D1D